MEACEIVNENKNRTLVVGVFVLLLVMGLAGVAAIVYFNVTGKQISFSSKGCFFPGILHIYCPGCGGTRAVRYLMRGDVLRSFMAHPLIIYLLILYIQSLWVSVYTIFIKRDMQVRTYVYIWQLWLMLGIVIAVFVVRNVLLVLFGYDFLGECAPYW